MAVDTYVDAKDTVNNWCVAIVKGFNFDEKTVRLGFEGWSSKHDIEIKRNSTKIAPFRTHSAGYTGQQKTAYRDFKISATYMAHMEKRLKQIMDSNFLHFSSAYECTQFIRGELYFYVDSLLTLPLIINQEDLPAILNFCELVLSLTLKWYELLPLFVPAWHESQVTPNLFNVDLAAAVSNCGPELSSIFGKMFGICKRAKHFFVKFKSDYIFDGKYRKEDQILSNGFLCSLTNKLGALNGFARLIAFSQRKEIPLSITTNLFCQLKYLHFFVVSSEAKEFGHQISESLLERLTSITYQELKNTEKEVMRKAINLLETYTRMHNAQTSQGQISETMELKIAFQYLRSPYFELRIRGMNDFKHVFHKVQNRNSNTDDQLRLKELEYAVFLNFEAFNNFMVENGVLELIFTETPHPELIKRSLEILYLRAVSKDKNYGMGGKLIDAIWQCCTERHEAVARAAFQVLQDLIQYVPITILEQLWQRVSTLEKQEFDEMRVSFLKQYTIGALHALKRYFDDLFKESQQKQLVKGQSQKKHLPVIQSNNYLDLKIFWSIAQEENTLANQKTKEFAMSSLIEILSSIQNYQFQGLQYRLDFLKSALDNLKAGVSVHTSIQFIRRVLRTFNQDNQSTTKFTGTQQQNNSLTEQSTRERVIQQLIQEKIYDLVHLNAESYIRSVQATAEDFQVDSRVGNSPFTHKERIDNIISLLEFLIVNSKSSNLDFAQLQNLFNVFVTCAVTSYESEQFFQFLTKENENSSTRERKYLLDERRMIQVFQSIICNQDMLDCSKLGQTGFDCFKMLFLNVNAQSRSLDINQNKLFTVHKLTSLQGFDTVWQIAIFCKDASVREQARNFIVDLYLNYKVPEKQRKEVTEAFIQKLDLVFSKQNQSGLHEHWLAIVSTFIRRFDFEHIQEQSLSLFDKNSNINIQVTLFPQNIVNTVQVNQNMKIWQLIIQIAKAFKMRASEFRIDTNNGLLDMAVYNDLIQAYNISSLRIRRIDEKTLDRESPRRILAQNQLLIKKMLDNITPKIGTDVLEVTVQQTFDLITDLPFNIDNRAQLIHEMQKIKKGSTDPNQAWCELFHLQLNQLTTSLDTVSPLTCYNLILLQDIFLPRSSFDVKSNEQTQIDIQERKTFLYTFVEKAGLQFLIQFFIAIKKQDLLTRGIKSCTLQVIQKLLIYLLSLQSDLVFKSLSQALLKLLLQQNLLLIQSLTENIIQKGSATKQNQVLMELTLKQVQRIIFLDPLLTTVLYEFPDFDATLLNIFTQLVDESIQTKVSDCLFQICQKIDFKCLEKAGLNLDTFQEQALSLPTFHFLSLILKLVIPTTLSIEQNTAVTKQLFLFTNKLLTETEVFKWLHVIEPVQTLVGDLAAMIKARPQLEVQAHACDEDFVLTGIITTLTNILAVQPSAQHQMQMKNNLIKYLLHECLFSKETKNQSKNAVPPKCKTQNSRLKCLQLIRALCVENDSGIALFVEYLRDEVFSNNVSWFWRTPRKGDWYVTSENKHERSITGYVGLKNIACICYMNSILQQLYMIPSFRKAMLEVWDRNSNTEPKSENCLYQIKRMFAGLNQASKQYYNPKKFCLSFKDIDGSPIDPRIQKDVDEFLNMFIDRIESLIKGTKEEAVMKNLLHGVFANELICKGCPHTSEREEPFMTLQIQVKDKHSILEGLDAFVEGEMLEGDNAYFCEKCDKKRDTLRRCTIKRLPNVLCLNLKRFEFNFDTMSKFKINDYCEFPMSLDMSKYTQDYIKRSDLLREMEEKNILYEELDREKQAIFNKQQCADYSQYSLVGIVVHQGTTEQGHYYSFIKERDSSEGNWFTFNDKDITNFNPEQIPAECFGGIDPEFDQRVRQHKHDAAMQQVIIQQGKIKNRNAYVLIYERSHIIDITRFTELTEDMQIAISKQDYQQLSQQMFNQCKITDGAQIQIQADIYTEIQEKNSRFWLTKHIFNKQFMELAYDIFALKNMPISLNYQQIKESPPDLTDNNLMIYKFIITFLLTVAQRSTARGSIPNYVKIVTAALKNSVALSLWLCETFSCQAIIREMLIECMIPDMSRFTAGLLNTAMQTLYQHEKRGILRYIEELGEIDNYLQSSQASHIKQIITFVPKERQQDDLPIFTPAEQVKIYKISSSTVELPSVIILINSFLHYQVSAKMQENYNQQMSAQFQRVICYFAELGPEASLYLLKTGCFNRFLKLFYSQPNDDHLLNEVPLFQLEQANQKHSLTRNASQSQNAKIPLQDRKQAVVTAISPSIFLLRALSLMISQCTTSNQSNTTLYILKKHEIELLVHEVANRNWWRAVVLDIPAAKNAISKIWATLCTNDNQQSQIYLKQIFTCISENNFQMIKRLGRFLLDFVNINDSYQSDRISRVLNLLYETLKKNTQYWKTADSLIELVIKLSCRSRMFALELCKNKNIIRMIEQITKENPSFPITPHGIKLFKDHNINWASLPPAHKQLVTESKVTAIGNYSKQRLSNFIEVLKHQMAGVYDETREDSDEDCYVIDFKEGDLVDVKFSKQNFNGWHTSEVILVLDVMVRVKACNVINSSNDVISMWIEKESSRLAKRGSQTQNDRAINHTFFCELFKLFEAANQTTAK